MERAQSSFMSDLVYVVRASLFAALIAVGSYILVPLPFSPVPVALQSFFILLAGLVLGKKWGPASVAVFLLAGVLGLPVFSGGKGGLAHFAGPTGGYLVSYIPAVFLTGYLSERFRARTGKNAILMNLLILSTATVVIYSLGVSWLAAWSAWLSASPKVLSLAGVLGMGVIPFLPGDIMKIILAAGIAPAISKFLEELPGSKRNSSRQELER